MKIRSLIHAGALQLNLTLSVGKTCSLDYGTAVETTAVVLVEDLEEKIYTCIEKKKIK